MSKNKVNILKVIYFDEDSAIDYLDLCHGGLKTIIKETQKGSNGSVSTEAKVEAKTGVIFNIISSILDVKGSAHLGGNLSGFSETALKTTITNTVLSDYIKTAEKDSSIKKITNCKVYAYKDSITYYKMYTPLLKMMKVEDENVDYSLMDKTLEESKGYYELIAESENNDSYILRFNLRSFRNNYNLIDLTRMDLTYYSVLVGKMKNSKLEAQNDLDHSNIDPHVSVDDVINQSEVDEIEVPIYDVVLAGITSNG